MPETKKEVFIMLGIVLYAALLTAIFSFELAALTLLSFLWFYAMNILAEIRVSRQVFEDQMRNIEKRIDEL